VGGSRPEEFSWLHGVVERNLSASVAMLAVRIDDDDDGDDMEVE
jgi:hypothetical protein